MMMIALLFGLDGTPILPPRKQFVPLRAKLGKQKGCFIVAGWRWRKGLELDLAVLMSHSLTGPCDPVQFVQNIQLLIDNPKGHDALWRGDTALDTRHHSVIYGLYVSLPHPEHVGMSEVMSPTCQGCFLKQFDVCNFDSLVLQTLTNASVWLCLNKSFIPNLRFSSSETSAPCFSPGYTLFIDCFHPEYVFGRN